MKRIIFVFVALLCLPGASEVFASSDPCEPQEDTFNHAEREMYRLDRKLSSNQERLVRAIEWRDSQVLRLDQRQADYMRRIGEAIADGWQRLHYFELSRRYKGCYNHCLSYLSLQRSIQRRIYNAQNRYGRFVRQRQYIEARYDAKVTRMATNVQLTQQDYDRAVVDYNAAKSALLTCQAAQPSVS